MSELNDIEMRPLPMHQTYDEVFEDPKYEQCEGLLDFVAAFMMDVSEFYASTIEQLLRVRLTRLLGDIPTPEEFEEHGECLVGTLVTEYWWDDTLLLVVPKIVLQDSRSADGDTLSLTGIV